MDTKAMIKQLFEITSKQNEVLKRLAQVAAPVPAHPAQADDSAVLTQKLQAALFAANPHMANFFIELPQVLTSPDAAATKIVSYKYHMQAGSDAVKAAVVKAANELLGVNQYRLQSIGE